MDSASDQLIKAMVSKNWVLYWNYKAHDDSPAQSPVNRCPSNKAGSFHEYIPHFWDDSGHDPHFTAPPPYLWHNLDVESVKKVPLYLLLI